MAETKLEMGGTDKGVQPPIPTQTQGGSSSNRKVKQKTTPVGHKIPK
jgi:hypothetical protein